MPTWIRCTLFKLIHRVVNFFAGAPSESGNLPIPTVYDTKFWAEFEWFSLDLTATFIHSEVNLNALLTGSHSAVLPQCRVISFGSRVKLFWACSVTSIDSFHLTSHHYIGTPTWRAKPSFCSTDRQFTFTQIASSNNVVKHSVNPYWWCIFCTGYRWSQNINATCKVSG